MGYPIFQNQVSVFILFVASTLMFCESRFLIEKHLLENTNVQRNEGIIIDLRQLLVQKGKFTADQVANASIYPGNKEASLPFIVDKGKIILQRRLDRERICPSSPVQQGNSGYYPQGNQGLNSGSSSNSQCAQQCCKIIHIEVSIDKTSLPHTFFVKLIIDDENDNSPRFPSVDTPFAYLKEDVPVGERVDLPVAYDPDSAIFSVKKYSIRNWRMGEEGHFKLNVDTENGGRPYLTVNRELDREKNSIYAFTLVAEDAGPSPNSGSVEIQIQISDVNDNSPLFDKLSYADMIPEHGPQKTLFHYQVTDSDEGENGRVEVTIRDPTGQAQRFFSAREDPNGMGGTLSLINEIDYEKHGQLFQFNLVAMDHGKPPRTAITNVEIRVNNINDHGPVIKFMNRGKKLDGNIRIQEGTPRGTLIAQLQVSDVDSKLDDIKCKLVRESEHFQLEESRLDHPFASYKQYSLQCVTNIDREARAKYNVVVQCTDSNLDRQLAVNGSLRVIVLDINDNAPRFQQETYLGHVTENLKGAEVKIPRNIQTTDADSGQNAVVQYSLQAIPNHDEENNLFTIDKSGKLSTNIALDFEKKQSYKFLVIAKDLGTPPHSSSATVSVVVRDKNDNQPEFTSSTYTFPVLEDSEIGTIIGRITAEDKDTDVINTRVIFHLEGHPDDMHLIDIDRKTGVIRTKRLLDAETKPTITFNVIAENETPQVLGPGIRSMDPPRATVVITVVNVNDNRPEFTLTDSHRTHVTFIWENLGQSHQNCEPAPYRVTDKDNEQSEANCCDLSLDDDHDGMFSLMPDAQYVLCALKKPPRPQSYKISITATDRNGNKTLSAKVTFTAIIQSKPGQQFYDKKNGGKLNSKYDDNQQITIIAILASVAGIFCIVLFVIIILLRKCSLENSEDEEKPQIHVLESAIDQGTFRRDPCSKMQPEVCTLLAENMGGDNIPDYYSEEEMCSAHNTYESSAAASASHFRRKLRNVDATLPSNRFSRSCESMDKAWRSTSLDYQHPRPPSQPQHSNLNMATIIGGDGRPIFRHQQSKMSEPSTKVPIYHTLHEETSGSPRTDYQIIDPFSSIRYKPAEYTSANMAGGSYQGYIPSGGVGGGDGEAVRVNIENDCSAYASKTTGEDLTFGKAGSKKSLRNAYFQTSFV